MVGQPARPRESAAPTPTASASPTHSPPAVTTSQPRVSPTPDTTASRPASPSPRTAASPSPAPHVKLAASVDVYGQGGMAAVVFSVTNTGTAATGGLTATIALPAGSSYIPDGHHWHHGHHGQGGWTCQATTSGASCQHAGIPSGGQAGGGMLIQVNGSSACGQPVQVTVTSGAESASAQSPETIQCGGGGDGAGGGGSGGSGSSWARVEASSHGQRPNRDMTCHPRGSDVGCRYIVTVSREGWKPDVGSSVVAGRRLRGRTIRHVRLLR